MSTHCGHDTRKFAQNSESVIALAKAFTKVKGNGGEERTSQINQLTSRVVKDHTNKMSAVKRTRMGRRWGKSKTTIAP